MRKKASTAKNPQDGREDEGGDESEGEEIERKEEGIPLREWNNSSPDHLVHVKKHLELGILFCNKNEQLWVQGGGNSAFEKNSWKVDSDRGKISILHSKRKRAPIVLLKFVARIGGWPKTLYS